MTYLQRPRRSMHVLDLLAMYGNDTVVSRLANISRVTSGA